MKRPSQARGFSLAETLVTMGIIAMLAALLFPAIQRTKESANRAKCLSHLREIGVAAKTYANDNLQIFPCAWDGQNTWDNLLITQGYAPKEIFACPSDKVPRTIPGDKRSYAINGYISDKSEWGNLNSRDGKTMGIKSLSSLILAGDRGASIVVINSPNCVSAYSGDDCKDNHVSGANYIFTDLHAEWLTDSGNYSHGSFDLWNQHWLGQ